MTINNKIQTYIENKGLKLVDISKKMGISKQNFNRILHSDDLKISQLIELCKILEVSPTYFFDGSETLSNSEIEGYKKEIETLKQENKSEEIRFKHFHNNIGKTLGWLLANKKTIGDFKYDDELIDVMKTLLENAHCQYEYAYDDKQLQDNIKKILKNPELMPPEKGSLLYMQMFNPEFNLPKKPLK